MKIVLQRKIFKNNIAIVSKAVAVKSPLPALTGILIEAKDNNLILTCCNEEMAIKSVLDNSISGLNLRIIEEGSLLIDCDHLQKIVGSQDSEDIEIEKIDGSLVRISCQLSEYKLNGMSVYDFPSISFLENNTNIFSINSVDLENIIDNIAFSSSEDKSRLSLTGINMISKNNVLECIATDSYRLSKQVINLENTNDFNIIIPTTSLRKFRGIANGEEKIDFLIENSFLQVNLKNYKIKLNLIDDNFPDTSRLIPTNFNNVIKVKADNLLKIIERATFININKKGIIKLIAKNNEVIVKSNSQEIGSYNDKLDIISFEGDPMEIAFNGQFLKEAIGPFIDKEVKIEFSGQLKPFLISSEDKENVIQLLVPIRTYN